MPASQSSLRGAARLFAAADRGAAGLEFVMVAPVLLAMLMGIAVYGGYFTLSHSLQQMANDAARASLAGLTESERRSLAEANLRSQAPTYPFVDPQRVGLTYAERAGQLTAGVTYDGTGTAIWSLSGLLPMPDPHVLRSAAVQQGGF